MTIINILHVSAPGWHFQEVLHLQGIQSQHDNLDMHRPYLDDSFIHSVFCLTTGPKPPLKRFHHIVRSRASFFK